MEAPTRPGEEALGCQGGGLAEAVPGPPFVPETERS